jgi:hypothetical protein
MVLLVEQGLGVPRPLLNGIFSVKCLSILRFLVQARECLCAKESTPRANALQKTGSAALAPGV